MELRVDLDRAGVPEERLRAIGQPLRGAFRELWASGRSGFLDVLRRPALLREIRAFARQVRRPWSDVVQLGIGGSSLGAQALCAALLPARHNERVGRAGPRCHFPDNVDPESFGALLDGLDPRRTLVHVVSKSGGTLETLAQLAALLEAFARRPARAPLRERFAVTTGERGPLREFAEREGLSVLTAPEDVPGRYSVFTASGLLVPALCGVPVQRVLGGARAMAERCAGDPLLGPAGRLAALHHHHDVDQGRPIHVELIYADALLLAGDWFRQIWAESLGKRGRGPTPVVARGTTDQHSQIQLYAEGPDDKLYTVVRVERPRARVRLGRKAEPPLLAGGELGAVFDAEARGTVEALVECGRPLVEIGLDRIGPERVGELLLMQQLQTALAGALYGVDPFTQPGVEAGKRAALRILGSERPTRVRGG